MNMFRYIIQFHYVNGRQGVELNWVFAEVLNFRGLHIPFLHRPDTTYPVEVVIERLPQVMIYFTEKADEKLGKLFSRFIITAGNRRSSWWLLMISRRLLIDEIILLFINNKRHQILISFSSSPTECWTVLSCSYAVSPPEGRRYLFSFEREH